MSAYSNEFVDLAEQRLTEAGFYERSVAQLELPPILSVETADNKPVSYQVYGDIGSARTIIIDTVPYSVSLSSLPVQVSLDAKQVALGSEFCVVGVQPYDPKVARFSHEELKVIRKHNFRPFADRVLTVVEALPIRDEQELVLQGYSLGADISIETNYQVISDPQRGIRRIDRLGATEYARGKNHIITGGFAIMLAFSRSGDELFDNIVASNSVALNEANNIDLTDPDTRKHHKSTITKGVLAYALSDLGGTRAGFRGAARDTSLQQLNKIGANEKMRPLMKVGRLDRSRICLPSFINDLVPHYDLETFVESGDHSTGDELRRGAAFALRTAS